MPALASDLRRQLENAVVEARDLAEAAARASLKRWAVDASEPFEHFSAADKSFRNRLRARGRQAGDRRDEAKKTQEIEQVVEELAYEYWHRMLFARFLAENALLMHPDGVAVTLAECDELAPSERAANGFVLAARYASRMLPEIFRTDDVLLEVEFPINDRLPLEKLLASLPVPVFTADDSLGWVYQFWQSRKKDEVNKTGQKIDGRSLPAVTQLFTEHYMVEFLLHNTIGAWWCASNGVQGPPGGAGVPEGSPVPLDYLRWKDDGTPAAGAFEVWPRTLKEFTMLDPCCGSGHFLVAGFHLLVPLRRYDEGLSAADAVDAVLRENLHGLEFDPRCTQIAAFALAMAAWRYPGDDGDALGYRPLPLLNIACSGQGVVGSKEDWVRFANGDNRFREGMERLYDLFQKAPTLGSLIDPRKVADDLFALGFATLKGTLDRALKKIEAQTDPDRAAVGVAAQGIATAASLMAREFTLISTNVPYLARGKQSGRTTDGEAEGLRDYLEVNFSLGRADLATAFVERCYAFCLKGGTTALVSPQNWWFLSSYASFRIWMLSHATWRLVASLGEEAWQSFGIRGPKTTLIIVEKSQPLSGTGYRGIDAVSPSTVEGKAKELRRGGMRFLSQSAQLLSPSATISLGESSNLPLLQNFATNHQGLSTGDNPRFRRTFWEVASLGDVWEREQSSPECSGAFGGRSSILKWEGGSGELRRFGRENVKALHNVDRRGEEAWAKTGVAIGQMRELPASLYFGHKFDTSVAILLPREPSILPALWAFCSSLKFNEAIRAINQKVSVDNGYLTKVPFDLESWQRVAAEQYPSGLPEPYSDDPTQWLFKGHPRGSTDPLHVAVARLLGYRWPDQESGDLDPLTDKDGIVPIPAARGESPAADRLREVLRTAFRSEWSGALETRLFAESGAKPGTTLDDWLRNGFFEQHCKRFHNRPFVWHLWDGRKDGFACLVNYHKLDHARLETLTYSYLQDWINAQAADAKSNKTGADLRLNAAQELQDKLKLILAGEPPHDIFVRWKPLAEQPIGWNPDLDDGIRLNIRPFMTAGVLRKNPNIKWTKDRGNDPKRDKDRFPWFWDGDTFTGERVNDIHLTTAQKQAARDRAK